MIDCDFCGRKLSTEIMLRRHQKTAKICLEKQNKPEINGEKCEYCTFSTRRQEHLKKHLSICKSNPANGPEALKEQVLDLKTRLETSENELKELKEKLENYEKIDLELKECKSVISDLNEKLIEMEFEKRFDKGRISELKNITNRPTVYNTNTINNGGNHIHSGLAKLTHHRISPLTVDLVKDYLDNGEYTREIFLQGTEGLAKFLSGIMKMEFDDGETEFNYACTDTSRSKFHRLTHELVWQADPQGNFLKEIYPLFKNYCRDYYSDVLSEYAQKQDNDSMNYVIKRCCDIVFGTDHKSKKSVNKLHVEIVRLIKGDLYVPKHLSIEQADRQFDPILSQ